MQIVSLRSLYLEFRDAIKEGDGLRVLRCYRHMLPIFRSSSRKNYAVETINLPFRQVSFFGAGSSTPMDTQAKIFLHCEHLNWLCKTAVSGLMANKTPECISRVAKAIGTISPVLENFDVNNRVGTHSTVHKEAKCEKDMKRLVSELIGVFTNCPERYHHSFRNPRIPLHAHSRKEILDWIAKTL